MEANWTAVARRMVQGLAVQNGELIEVQDDADRPEVLREILLAIECAGATPLLRIASPSYLERLLNQAPIDYLDTWDRHRREWLAKVDRRLVLGSIRPDFSSVNPERVKAWNRAVERLTTVEEDRRLPVLVAGIPTAKRAEQSGLSFDALEELLLVAMAATVEELRAEIDDALEKMQQCDEIVIQSKDRYELKLHRGSRQWMSDDACIDDNDRRLGAIVSNLPGGSIYTTVLESETEGSLWIPTAGKATDVVLRFERGRVVRIEAESGGELLQAMFDQHDGEPRRIGHIGLGLNPYLRRPIGWTLVDEHVHGHLFVSFGENRYMGGENQSSLNIDFSIPDATLLAGDRMIVKAGQYSRL